MKTIAISFALAILGLTQAQAQCSKEYELVWSDEFNESEIDSTKWGFERGDGSAYGINGWGNKELQYYREENTSISDGALQIKIDQETIPDDDWSTKDLDYTSAKLTTENLYAAEYGKVEASIKMPTGVGFWTAFWMLGDNHRQVGWPKCGEIDIMEWVGQGPENIRGTIFYEGTWPDNHTYGDYGLPEGQSFIDEFHTYSVEWEPNEIRWYVDDNLYSTVKASDIEPKEWVFNHPFYIILNCAVGGTGGGNVINAEWPQYMGVDYVRVYSLPTLVDSLSISGKPSVFENSQNVKYNTIYLPESTYQWSVPDDAQIISGQNTNSIQVDFGINPGYVKVVCENACTKLSDSIWVSLIKDGCEVVYDDVDSIRYVNYTATGTLTTEVENPQKDTINGSEKSLKYVRSEEETWDVLSITDVAIENAVLYENSEKFLFMDVFTDAPIDTKISIQLEQSGLNDASYPQGRRSSFTAYTIRQNGWQTLKFTFEQIISSQTKADQIDYLAVLIDPGDTSSNTYYLDNLRRINNDDDCDLPLSNKGVSINERVNVYPVPSENLVSVDAPWRIKSFKLVDENGQVVLHEYGKRTLNISGLPSGIFTLQLVFDDADQMVYKKIVKF